MLADALTKALCEAKFAKSILTQDTLLDQSGSVEDQARAARFVIKQVHASWRQAQGSGSIPRNNTSIHSLESQWLSLL